MVKRIPKFTPRKKDRDLLSKVNKSLYQKERRINLEFGKSMGIKKKKLDEFRTRKEFNEYIEKVKYNTHRNQHRYVKNAKGLVVTRKSYRQAKRNDEKYQKKQRKELEKIRNKPMKSGGKDTGFKVGDYDNDTTMGRPSLDGLKIPKFNFDNIENMREWELKQRRLEQRADDVYLFMKNTQLRENYLTAIAKVFGHGEAKMDSQDIGWELYNHIANMDLEEFIGYYMSEFDVSIGFIYNAIQAVLKLNRLHNIFGIDELDVNVWVSEDDEWGDDESPEDFWI